jgi:hypothetical protein
MTDAATVPSTDATTNGDGTGAGARQQRLAAAVKNLRTRQSLSAIPVDRWVLIAGAIMVPLGIALIILGWYGAAHKALSIQQFPYLISGGILGLGLMITGGLAYFGYWITRLVQENRTNTRELLAAIDRLAAVAGDEQVAGTAAVADGMLVATATGTMLHRPDCPVVANRPGVRRVKASTPGMVPCKICEPEVVDLTSA